MQNNLLLNNYNIHIMIVGSNTVLIRLGSKFEHKINFEPRT